MTVTQPADLLTNGAAREPWQPSPRIKHGAIALIALCLTVAGALMGWRYLQEQHRLDRAAEAAVAVYLSNPGSGYAPSYDLLVTNAGPAPVRLLDVQLLGQGSPQRRLDKQIAPASALTVRLAPGTRCGANLWAAGFGTARLKLRTSRGNVMSYTANIVQPAVLVQEAERGRCGRPEPYDGLRFALHSAGTRGSEVSLLFEGMNASSKPVTVDAFTGTPGLAVTATAPVVLPADARSGVPISVKVRVTSCALLRRSPGAYLYVRVHNDFGHTVTGLRDVDSGYGPLTRLAQLCR